MNPLEETLLDDSEFWKWFKTGFIKYGMERPLQSYINEYLHHKEEE